MARVETLRHDELLRVLRYEALTGKFFWLVACGRNKAGDEAGGLDADGYWRLKIFGTHYRRARLAWFYCHKVWPSGEADHRYGERLDDRIAELRDISHQGNCENLRKPMPKNKSGFLGVSWHAASGMWQVSIKTQGRSINLGKCVDPAVGGAMYVAAKRTLHAGGTL